MEIKDPDIPINQKSEIYTQLNASFAKYRDLSKGKDAFETHTMLADHFRDEFIRLKIEQYRQKERDKAAFNEMVLSKWSKHDSLRPGDEVTHSDYADETFIVSTLEIIGGRLIVKTTSGKNGTWDNPIELVTKKQP
ncbi:MAG: hypothetical protein ACRCYO_13440 [Bacteroidia bacterium]